jgi:hypothetical protein
LLVLAADYALGESLLSQTALLKNHLSAR